LFKIRQRQQDVGRLKVTGLGGAPPPHHHAQQQRRRQKQQQQQQQQQQQHQAANSIKQQILSSSKSYQAANHIKQQILSSSKSYQANKQIHWERRPGKHRRRRPYLFSVSVSRDEWLWSRSILRKGRSRFSEVTRTEYDKEQSLASQRRYKTEQKNWKQINLILFHWSHRSWHSFTRLRTQKTTWNIPDRNHQHYYLAPIEAKPIYTQKKSRANLKVEPI